MAWTTPMTFVAGSVLTAAQLNTHLRDNLNETAPAKATAAGQIFASTAANTIAARTPSQDIVSASETTTSTSYADLATTGPTVTVATGSKAFVIFGCLLTNNTIGSRSAASYAVSGATSVAASDSWALFHDASTAGRVIRASIHNLHTGLTPGVNVFTMQYRVSANTGTFQLRSMCVIPF